MTSFSIIKKSELEGVYRLDAEYYQPEYLSYLGELKRSRVVPLSMVTDKIDVGFVSSMKDEFQETGIPLLRTQNVKEFFVDLNSDVVYIDENFHSKLKKSQVFPGYILLARSGTIGEAAIVPKDFSVANSADIILIKPKEDIEPEYLAAYLNSKYGKFQIDRATSGGLQGHMNLFSLEKLWVPLLNADRQKKVKQVVVDGLRLLEASKSLYSQAEDLLFESCGVKGEVPEEDLFRVVNFSDVKKVGRIDAEYFQNQYDKLVAVTDCISKPLSEVIENVPAKFNPGTEPDKSFKYVELSNINALVGTIEGFSEVLGKEAPGRAKRVLRTGDVVVSSVEGSLEKVALVDGSQNGYLASTGFFQFRSGTLLPEVILVLAKSYLVQRQLKQRCAGTILTAVPKESINDILIPVVPKPIQQKIADLVMRSHEARKKAKELLEEAKRKVEDLIENQNT